MGQSGDAIDKIQAMIRSGQLKPGDRLPREQDLAAELGVSRNALREAVSVLSFFNVLNVRQGDGTYVTSLGPDLLLGAVTFVVDFYRDHTVLHFTQVRRILEPVATAQAAVTITEADLVELERLLERTTSDASVEDLVRYDIEFHRRIVAACGNPVLSSLIDSLTAPMTRARIYRGLLQQGSLDRTHHEHRAILRALRSRRPDVAQAWASVHIEGTEEWLESSLAPPPAAPTVEPVRPRRSRGPRVDRAVTAEKLGSNV